MIEGENDIINPQPRFDHQFSGWTAVTTFWSTHGKPITTLPQFSTGNDFSVALKTPVKNTLIREFSSGYFVQKTINRGSHCAWNSYASVTTHICQILWCVRKSNTIFRWTHLAKFNENFVCACNDAHIRCDVRHWIRLSQNHILHCII